MGTEKIPNIPMREKANLKEIYESGRRYGLYQAEKIIKSHIENTCPINCKSIIEELTLFRDGGKS